MAVPPPRPPSPSFLPLLPLLPPLLPPRRPRPEHLLPPHVTRQRAMQITAAAGSHWPRRAHLMAARARRMAAGPRAPPAPRAPPLRAHGLGQAVGSQSRARRPRSQALSARLRSQRCPPAPLPNGPPPRPPRRLAPPGHLGPAHAQRTRRAALLEVAAPELEAAEDPVQEEGGSPRQRPARSRQRAPGQAPRAARVPKSGAATWPRLHLFAPLCRGDGAAAAAASTPAIALFGKWFEHQEKLCTCEPDLP